MIQLMGFEKLDSVMLFPFWFSPEMGAFGRLKVERLLGAVSGGFTPFTRCRTDRACVSWASRQAGEGERQDRRGPVVDPGGAMGGPETRPMAPQPLGVFFNTRTIQWVSNGDPYAT